jgi:hypothetical protein
MGAVTGLALACDLMVFPIWAKLTPTNSAATNQIKSYLLRIFSTSRPNSPASLARNKDSDMREKRIPWTPEEEEIGRRLLEEHASEAEFLEKLGRTKEVARKHFYYVEHRAMVLLRRGEVPVRRGPTRQVTIANAPSIAMIDDAQRPLAAPRSLTSEYFGDPLPGRSALDRK